MFSCRSAPLSHSPANPRNSNTHTQTPLQTLGTATCPAMFVCMYACMYIQIYTHNTHTRTPLQTLSEKNKKLETGQGN